MIEKIFTTPCSKGGTHTIVMLTNGSAIWSCSEDVDLQYWPNFREA